MAQNDVYKSDEYIYWIIVVGIFVGFRLLAVIMLKNKATKLN